MEQHLFVYGTLMTAAHVPLGRSLRTRLQREAESLGAATMPGRLYDLGRYPGMVVPGLAGELVHGEVLRLSEPARALPWLDAYEGVRPDDTASEYERRVLPAILTSGEEIAAWAYLYRGDLTRARHLPDGRWQPQVPAGRKRS